MQLTRLGVAAALLLAPAATATADGASGTWTGQVELRGSYYWETSTRVVAPSLEIELESPRGVRLEADYLVDTITSASQAFGALIDNRFREVRHDVGGGVGYELDLGEQQLDVVLRGRFSTEPDYRSRSITLAPSLSLNERTTVFHLALTYLNDEVSVQARGGSPMGCEMMDIRNGQVVGRLQAVTLGAGFDQVLSPSITASVGYDFGLLDGFLENWYRRLPIGGRNVCESHPDRRRRHNLWGRLALYSRPTHTAIHVIHRAYVDSWDVAAVTPETRIYQEIGPFLQVRLRHRYYRQTNAFFSPPSLDDLSMTGYTPDDVYYTADPKLSRFHSHLLGVQLRLAFDFLEGTALSFLSRASVDMSFEYIWNTNRYGDGVVSQLGFLLPF